jgi:hypothetical protein
MYVSPPDCSYPGRSSRSSSCRTQTQDTPRTGTCTPINTSHSSSTQSTGSWTVQPCPFARFGVKCDRSSTPNFHQPLPKFSSHYESQCKAPSTKFTHCSKFKTHLDTSDRLLPDASSSLELFVDGIKRSLDTLMSMYYSIAQYAEWARDYLLTTALCPSELSSHPHYTAMYVNCNTYGQVLFRYLHSALTIGVESCPNDYYELMALDHIKCG